MEGSIKIDMGDWLFNAGLVGMYNILQKSNSSVNISGQTMELHISDLEDFEEKYFSYFIETYEKSLSWYKIVSYEKTINYHEENNFENFDEKSLKELNDYIRDVAKYYLKSASYKSAYPLLDNDIDLLALEKELTAIRLKKKETVSDVLLEIKDRFEKLKVIISFCKREKSKKYLASKNVIYNIIKNAWEGVCFLNSQTKEKDVYIDYKNYFVEPAKEYLEIDDSKFKYNCFICDEKIKDLKDDLSFLNNTGFDVARKSSHVWDFTNDVAVCPLCKLIYSCVPAGITYVYDKGIYVNDNSSMENAIRVNTNIKLEVLRENENTRGLTYKALVSSIQEQFNDKLKYELADIQLVRYEDNNYKFNILSKSSLNIIRNSRDDLDKLIKCGFRETNTYFNVYELVIDRLLNSQNLFTLIHKMFIQKLSKPNDSYFNTYHIKCMLEINRRFLQGVGCMTDIEKETIVKHGNTSGYYLRQKYKDKGAVDKLSGISYRLLNALKTNNVNSFMDTILNCYLYVKDTVPSIILDTLKTEEEFKTIGYALVAGLIEGKENGGESNEK